MDIQQALATVVEGNSLQREEMQAVMRQIMSGDATDAQVGGLLVALRMKGETTEEVAGAAQVMALIYLMFQRVRVLSLLPLERKLLSMAIAQYLVPVVAPMYWRSLECLWILIPIR